MANLSRLNQLNPRRSNWEVMVKILKKWVEIRQYQPDVLHFLLKDRQRTKVHAYVKVDRELFQYFNQRMYEGQWKILKRFIVVNAPESVGRFADNPFELIINEHTDLDSAQGTDLPHYMEFEDFKRVKAGQRLTPNPLDFIGYLDSVTKPTWVHDATFTLTDEKTTARIECGLKDTSGTSIKCVAYGELALQINDRWFKNGHNEVIMTLRDWKLAYSTRTGEYKIKSIPGISRFEFNADLYDVDAFRWKYFVLEEKNSADDQSSSSSSDLSVSSTSSDSSGSDESGGGAGPSGTASNGSGDATEVIIID
ncbi:unnamed protein product [Microthlaspi erraticum]|uniref:Replication protein A 70 kDa DNA-binding subunit B/D first OB fold domain-containing protein n=1 Tax=Microthlaspi erraticum TaxID=1685480 RepID=A0A6D2J6J5_9BRAS|nr:unnamed protein product [Microthlaspi erraticum]